MALDLLINTSDPQQRGLIASILDGGIAPFPNFTRNDQSVAITIQPVVPSTGDTRNFDVDYTTGDTYQVSIGSADEAPTAGTFALSISSVTTNLTALSYAITAADLQTPLSAAAVAGGNPAVTVTLLSTGVYQVDGVTNGALATIVADTTNLIPVCSAVVTVVAAGSGSTKGQQIIRLVQQPAAYATPSTALPTASVTVTTEQAATSTLNQIIRIAFAAGTYGGLYSLSATVNSVTAVCGSVSPVASIGELSSVLGRHPQLRYNSASAPNNFTVSTDGPAYLVEFIGNIGAPATPTLSATNVSLLAPFGASGTISLNSVNMAKLFWSEGVASLALTLSVVRTRTSGEVKTILSIPVTVPADIINAGSLTPISGSGAVRYDISQSLSAAEKLQAVTNQGLNLTASKLLGQASSGGTGLPVAITLGTNLSMSGTTLNAVDSATGTVTSVSVTTANGVSGTVATATTTPAISLTLGAITPNSVNGVTVSGSGSLANSGTSSLTGFTGSGTSSGTNTGDQTSVSGNAGTATALATARNIFNISFNGTANVAGDATNTGHFASIPGTGAAGHFITENGTTPTLIAGRSAWYSDGSGIPSFKNGTSTAVSLVRSSDLGTNVATALAIAVGSAGAFVTFNGAGGTPSSMTATNLSGTAASLTAGLVTSIGNLTGDVTSSNRATTLATVNANVGSFGSATQSLTITANGKGLITAISAQTITPAVGSITGLGTGVATWLATPSGANLASALTSAIPVTKGGTGGTTAYTAITGLGSVSPLGALSLKDDFFTGTNVAGSIGELGWTVYNVAGSGSGVYEANGLLGAFKLTTGSTSGNCTQLYFPNSSAVNVSGVNAAVFEMWWRVKIDTVTNVAAYLGFSWNQPVVTKVDNAGSGANDKGYWFRFDTSLNVADAQWTLVTCDDATGTTGHVLSAAFTGSISAGVYYTLKMRGDGTGAIYGTMYDSAGTIVGSEISVANTRSISNGMFLVPQITTKTSATRALSIDFFGLAINPSR